MGAAVEASAPPATKVIARLLEQARLGHRTAAGVLWFTEHPEGTTISAPMFDTAIHAAGSAVNFYAAVVASWRQMASRNGQFR